MASKLVSELLNKLANKLASKLASWLTMADVGRLSKTDESHPTVLLTTKNTSPRILHLSLTLSKLHRHNWACERNHDHQPVPSYLTSNCETPTWYCSRQIEQLLSCERSESQRPREEVTECGHVWVHHRWIMINYSLWIAESWWVVDNHHSS